MYCRRASLPEISKLHPLQHDTKSIWVLLGKSYRRLFRFFRGIVDHLVEVWDFCAKMLQMDSIYSLCWTFAYGYLDDSLTKTVVP